MNRRPVIDIELQSIASVDTRVSTSNRSTQPLVADMERSVAEQAPTMLSRVQSALSKAFTPTQTKIIAVSSTGLITAAAFSSYYIYLNVQAGKAASLKGAYALNQFNYCAQFKNFTWVQPSFVGAQVIDDDGNPPGVTGANFANFKNVPEDLQLTCMLNFNTSIIYMNPSPSPKSYLNEVGPFPGTSTWYYVDSLRQDSAPIEATKILYQNVVSDFNPTAKIDEA